ncbi:hypothetical protein AWB83_02531 [Caballeronia ptereochthonis]|uniref:Uncharacterized protein n=1 Tax=Caballeronia ptereochthonis TaxID=1777144 RepID=A0A158AY87_9BURK|nr:hypothetical protein AWB83_02531 [Caballeronia ptereochthonis]
MKKEPSSRLTGFLSDLKWMLILWLLGVGATALLVLPIRVLIAAMMRKY